MISTEDAKTARIIRFAAQILRASESVSTAGLLKAFFNDSPLISPQKCRNSAPLIPGGEIG